MHEPVGLRARECERVHDLVRGHELGHVLTLCSESCLGVRQAMT